MASDLPEAQKRKIFDIVDSVQPPSRYKALIIDTHVARIIDHIMDRHELLDRNVSSIQLIDSRRPTEQYLEAIYIIKPTSYNLECLNTDYIRAPPRYAGAHLFFLPELSAELALKVKNSAVGRFLKHIDTVYIDFWPVESQIFSLDDPNALEIFYGSQCGDLVDKHATQTAAQLVSICATLNEYPVIRFLNSPEPESFRPKLLPFMIADKFQKLLDKYVREHPSFRPASDDGRPRSVFLIVDRPIDLYAPLLHEFTFQALAYDLLPIEDGIHYEYELEKQAGVKEKVKGTITDRDAEWVGLRHQHMREATDIMAKKIEKLKKENPHFADESSKTTVTDLQDMVAALPEFMQTRDRFTLLINMASECMRILETKDLISLADIEQTCALSGVAADGRKSKSLTDEFIVILAENPKLNSQDKVRLITLYVLYRGGIIEEDLKKLGLHAGLSVTDIEVIKNYAMIGATVIKQLGDKTVSGSSSSHFHIRGHDIYKSNSLLSTGSKIKKGAPIYNSFHTHATEDVYSVSRFIPGLKNIAEALIKGSLNSQLFQYTKDEPVELDNDVDLSNTSLRNPRQRAAWAKSSTYQAAKQRVFVFVAGGLTQSEARAAYELNKQYPREVVFGGSTILTPGALLGALSRFSVPRSQLKLPYDAPKKRAPSYLMESDRETKKVQQQQQEAQAPPQKQPKGQFTPHSISASSVDSKEKPKEKKKSKFKLFK